MKTLVNLAVIAACRPPPGSPRGREATCPPARGVVRKTMPAAQMSRLALLTPATTLTIVPCSSPYDDTGSSIQRGTSREVGRPHSVAALSRSKRQPPRRSFDPRSPVRVRSGERNLSATIALPQIHIFPPPTAVDDFIIKGTKPSVLSFIKCRIKTFEFHAGIVGGELPIHLGLDAVACQAATSRRNTSMRRFRRIMTLSSTTFSQLPCLGV